LVAPRFVIPQEILKGFLEVLVLARPSDREDGTLENQNTRLFPEISLGNPR
jgi:hypothetical protein